MTERLCLKCQPHGRCLFKEFANDMIEELKLRNITDPETLKIAAAELHDTISKSRNKARKHFECPYNTYEPDYPGKESL